MDSVWIKQSCEFMELKENLYVYPLEDKRFMFSSKSYSQEPRQVDFIGVHETFGDAILYDLILGSNQGSGAFALPFPRVVFPYTKSDESAGPRKSIEEELKTNKDITNPATTFSRWMHLMTKYMPYCFIEGDASVMSNRDDISSLKDIVTRFEKELTDKVLPDIFRNSVIFVARNDVPYICQTYDIPILV